MLLAILAVRLALFVCTLLVTFMATMLIFYLKWHHVERTLLAILMIVTWWCVNSAVYIAIKQVELEHVAPRR